MSSHPDRYKWIALSNTTLAVLLATLDASITLIAMPDIFRGIHLDPLTPANSFYLLWMILGYLIGFRIVQGIGGACLLANAAAIITDAFPVNERGMALGINNIVGVSGLFVGLLLGGLLAPIDWRLVFLISVPVGLFGTVWAYLKLEERSRPRHASIDWWGNATFALGLVLAMVAVTYGIRPYGGSPTGWESPRVLALLAGSALSLAAFAAIELRVAEPISGVLSDRFGARPFATGGMLGAALSFALLMLLPADFDYWIFALILFFNGVSMGMFAAPNRAAVMNSLPPGDRGAGGGMNQTFQNSAQVLSIGIFFTLLVIGLASSLPATIDSGLQAHGISSGVAHHASQAPPISILFAAFLGYNPVQHLVGTEALAALPAHAHATLTGSTFFPALISAPFRDGLDTAFTFAIVACLVAAAASLLRGGRYHHSEEPARKSLAGAAHRPAAAPRA